MLGDEGCGRTTVWSDAPAWAPVPHVLRRKSFCALRLAASSQTFYSHRSARVGSTLAARRAGT